MGKKSKKPAKNTEQKPAHKAGAHRFVKEYCTHTVNFIENPTEKVSVFNVDTCHLLEIANHNDQTNEMTVLSLTHLTEMKLEGQSSIESNLGAIFTNFTNSDGDLNTASIRIIGGSFDDDRRIRLRGNLIGALNKLLPKTEIQEPNEYDKQHAQIILDFTYTKKYIFSVKQNMRNKGPKAWREDEYFKNGEKATGKEIDKFMSSRDLIVGCSSSLHCQTLMIQEPLNKLYRCDEKDSSDFISLSKSYVAGNDGLFSNEDKQAISTITSRVNSRDLAATLVQHNSNSTHSVMQILSNNAAAEDLDPTRDHNVDSLSANLSNLTHGAP
ncbi:MAG: hypothetical protein HOI53_05150 [Francisellaceae bacterium]|jgi:hypothetical protein|nr:hypothetical protein [Francisellaceae bacterium]MBT6207392.1 hypothetical protein [Francisellaceae bacterium]MBT6539367.1 hypothetical protein [Francisellaceae bacterium]